MQAEQIAQIFVDVARRAKDLGLAFVAEVRDAPSDERRSEAYRDYAAKRARLEELADRLMQVKPFRLNGVYYTPQRLHGYLRVVDARAFAEAALV